MMLLIRLAWGQPWRNHTAISILVELDSTKLWT